jgi:hypothetical protein
MKAPIAQVTAEAASSPGCAFIFFWVLEIVNSFEKNRILAEASFCTAE